MRGKQERKQLGNVFGWKAKGKRKLVGIEYFLSRPTKLQSLQNREKIKKKNFCTYEKNIRSLVRYSIFLFFFFFLLRSPNSFIHFGLIFFFFYFLVFCQLLISFLRFYLLLFFLGFLSFSFPFFFYSLLLPLFASISWVFFFF